MDLGERIDAWCKATGKTYQDLADAAEVTVAAVYQWVGTGNPRVRKNPQQPHLEAVVAELGVTMERFYGKVPAAKKAKAS